MYAPDQGHEGYDDSRQTSFLNRLTWRVTDSNKVTGYIDKQTKYIGHIAVSSTNVPEASSCQCSTLSMGRQREMDVHLEPTAAARVGLGVYNVEWDYENQDDVPLTAFRINDQITGRNHGAPGSQQRNISSLHSYTAKLSWVTGTHTLSGGLNGSLGSYNVITTRGNGDVSEMRYGTIGVGAPGADATGYGPNRVTLNLPTENFNKIDGDNGFWVTDRMTYKRATITAGLRFDWFLGSVGDSAVLPNRWTDAATYRGLRRLAQLEGSQSAARLRVRFVRQRENGAESLGLRNI